jgi:hypothetical protein
MKRIKTVAHLALCIIVSTFLSGLCAQSVPYQWKSVAIRGGGFVPGLIFSPVQKGMLYARTDMAGAYRWDDANGKWIPIMDWLTRADFKYIGVESIAADPVDSNIVYMAIGTYTSGGNGLIVKSTDRGLTWTRNTIAAPMGGNNDGRSVGERLMIDPNNTKILYFASRTVGLWKSIDAGATWNRVTSFPVTGNSGIGLSFVTFDKKSGTYGKSSSTIYVGAVATASGSNLYRSTDTGATWALVTGTGGPSGLMPHHGVFGPNGVMWLAYNNGQPPSNASSGAVWKYNQSSAVWTNVNPAGHGGGIGGISVSATDSNYAVAATIDWWNPDEVYRTTNGGTSWTGVGKSAQHDRNGSEYLCFGNGAGCTNSQTSYGGWCGDIEIDPFSNKRVFYVTGQGNWCSVNVDTTPVAQILWKFQNVNFEETVVLEMTNSVKKSFFSIVGDIGGSRHSTDSLLFPPKTGMYSNPLFTNGHSVDFAGLNPNIVIRCGTPTTGSTPPLGAWSTNNGVTWSPFASQSGTGTGKVAVSANGSTFVWDRLYSRNNGSTWTACTGLPSGARIAADRVNPNKFYSFSGGTLYASTDGAATFSAATTGLSGTGRASAVFGMEGEVWVAADPNLYHSVNSGANAVQVGAGTIQHVYSIGFGKALSGNSYPAIYLVGTVNNVYGVFRSDNTGATWTRINDDNHQFGEIDYCAGDEDYAGRVYLGTQGRGVLYGEAATTSISSLQLLNPHKSDASLLRIHNRIVATVSGQLYLMDMKGRVVRRGTKRWNTMELNLAGLRNGVYIACCGAAVLRVCNGN